MDRWPLLSSFLFLSLSCLLGAFICGNRCRDIESFPVDEVSGELAWGGKGQIGGRCFLSFASSFSPTRSVRLFVMENGVEDRRRRVYLSTELADVIDIDAESRCRKRIYTSIESAESLRGNVKPGCLADLIFFPPGTGLRQRIFMAMVGIGTERSTPVKEVSKVLKCVKQKLSSTLRGLGKAKQCWRTTRQEVNTDCVIVAERSVDTSRCASWRHPTCIWPSRCLVKN